MKLTTKNFIIINSITFLVVTVTLVALYIFMPAYYEQVKINQNTSAFKKIVKTVDGLSQKDMINRLKAYERKNQSMYLYLLKDNVVVYPEVSMSFPTTDSDSIEIAISPISTDMEMRSVSKQITTANGEVLTLEAQYSLQPVSDASHILLQIYPFILVVALMLGTVTAYAYSQSSTKRIKRLSQVTRKMVDLEDNLSCDIKGRDEIAELGRDIDWMYRNLRQTVKDLENEIKKTAESERSKEEFLRITSHELKTPIAGMMGMIDGMIFEIGDFKNRDHYLKECRRILEEQNQLVQSILDVSKIGASDILQEDNWEWFSLSEMLQEKMEFYQLLANLNHYQLSYSFDPIRIKAHKNYFEKAVKNVIDNAFRYTHSNGKISIELKKQKLVIKNQPQYLLMDIEIEQIFMPFYRPDYSRNREDGGTGLGLFIVKNILDRHQISYRFSVVDEIWMCFEIDLEKLL